MFRYFISAVLLSCTLAQPVLAAKAKKSVDQTDTVKALVRPGSATRKLETANRATAIAFWQAICNGSKTDGDSKYLAADFVNHAPGLAAGGEAFIDALRTREQSWKLPPAKAPLFALSTGQLVMIGEGADAKNPQAGFHVSVLRLVDGKVTEYWANGS